METVIQSFTTAITAMASGANSMIAAAVPVALPIAGVVLAVRIGWKVAKQLTN